MRIKWSSSQFYRGDLSDWFELNPKRPPLEFEDEEIVSFVPMDAVSDKDGTISKRNTEFAKVSKGYTVFQENDLIWAKITPCMQNGKSAVARNLYRGVGFGSTEFHVLRPRTKEADIDFLWNLLRLESFLEVAQGAFTGSAGQQRVPASFLKEFPIPLPPLEIQRALVEEMQQARETRRGKLADADALLQSLDDWLLDILGIAPPPADNRQTFAVRFGNLQGRIDSRFYQPYFKHVVDALEKSAFPLTEIRQICESPVGGATPKKGSQDLYADDGIKFLRILNVKTNQIDLNDVKFIADAVHNNELQRSQLKADDVLMTITGRVGTSAVVPENILPANINQHIVRLRLKSDEILPEYLAAYLNSEIGLANSNRYVTGGTRIALDYEAIRAIKIPKPPKLIQERIVEHFDFIKNQSQNLRIEAEAEWQQAKDRFETALLGA